jgi:hypothetical protein
MKRWHTTRWVILPTECLPESISSLYLPRPSLFESCPVPGESSGLQGKVNSCTASDRARVREGDHDARPMPAPLCSPTGVQTRRDHAEALGTPAGDPGSMPAWGRAYTGEEILRLLFRKLSSHSRRRMIARLRAKACDVPIPADVSSRSASLSFQVRSRSRVGLIRQQQVPGFKSWRPDQIPLPQVSDPKANEITPHSPAGGRGVPVCVAIRSHLPRHDDPGRPHCTTPPGPPPIANLEALAGGRVAIAPGGQHGPRKSR